MAKKFVKSPHSLLDYKMDWQEFLDTDNILSALAFTDAESSAHVSGVRVANYTVSGDNGVIVWLSGGAEGAESEITVRIWSSAGRRNDDCFLVAIESC